MFFCLTTNFVSKALFVCLAAETGEVLYKSESMAGFIYRGDNNFLYIAQEEMKLVKMNPLNFSAESFDFTEQLNPHNLRVRMAGVIKEKIIGNKLYFYSPGSTVHIGVIDLNSKELLGFQKIPSKEMKYWISQIEVNENRLFVLTDKGTLLIYDMEF